MESRLFGYLKHGFIAIGIGFLMLLLIAIAFLSGWQALNVFGNLMIFAFIYGLVQIVKHLYWTAPARIDRYMGKVKHRLIEEEDERNQQIKGQSAILQQKLMNGIYLGLILILTILGENPLLLFGVVMIYIVHYVGSKLIYVILERKG